MNKIDCNKYGVPCFCFKNGDKEEIHRVIQEFGRGFDLTHTADFFGVDETELAECCFELSRKLKEAFSLKTEYTLLLNQKKSN
jgi:hypothetical protein